MIAKNSITELENITLSLENFFAENSLPSSLLFEVNLVIEEIFTNIVFYAFTDKSEQLIYIFIEKEGDLLNIKIEDSGLPFDPLSKQDPDFDKPLQEREIGGLGIHLIKNLVNNIEYQRIDEKNILKLTKSIPKN